MKSLVVVYAEYTASTVERKNVYCTTQLFSNFVDGLVEENVLYILNHKGVARGGPWARASQIEMLPRRAKNK